MAEDDLSNEYMDHRTRLANASAADELLSRIRSRPPEAPGMPAAPATSPGGLESLITGEKPKGSMAGRIAKDVGLGVIETPRGVVKGVRDAYQNTINMARELGDWMESNNLGGGVVWDQNGVRFASGKELQELEKDPNFFRPANYADLPDINAPKTVTGGMVKGITQFITGMKLSGGAMKMAGLPEAAGALGYSRAALQGFLANFAAFDPHQQRLSDLIEQFPSLQNPVTEFLASDPRDSAAQGRFKNALEGLGLGVLTDGFIKGVKILRQTAFAKKALEGSDEAAMAAATAQELPDTAFRDLGNEAANAPLVSPKPFSMPDVAPGDFKAQPQEGKVFINFARIDTPDDVKRVMQRLADVSEKGINAGRRGVQSFEQTKLNAAQQDAWNVLMTRRMGEPLNAEQSVAARELWVSATDKLSQLADAASSSPSEANLFAFRKMLSVHDAIQKEVIAARTETARALSSWRIPVGSSAERLQNIAGVLEQNGGSEVTRELAQRVSVLAKAGMVSELQGVVEKGAYATTRDAVMEAWINGLLSNPATHAANTVSNSSVLFLRMAERKAAAKIGSLLGTEGGVDAQEAAAQWYGLMQGHRDAFRYAAKAARTGESGFGLGKIEGPRQGAISSEAFGLASDTALGRGADLLGAGVRIPGRALGAEDEFFKTLGYRMELHAQALRQAVSELPDATDDMVRARMADLIENPPPNIKLAAVDAATYQTFNNTPGKLAQSIGRLTSEYPALKVILPFTRTPANILSFTFERTPLAPLLSKFRANLAAGGARRDLALAQMALGTSAMLAFADATMSGQVSGRGPVEKGTKEAMMREGWKPYSIKVGERWYPYNRLDPIGSLIGMSADATETFLHADHAALDDPDTEKLAVAGALAFAGNITNKTYLSGLSSVIEALNDPQRSAESWSQRLAGSVIPAGVAGVTRLEDPTVREVNSMGDAIRARIPGLSGDLPPRLDMWGDPITTESGFGKAFDAFTPVTTKKPTPEPIDQELLRLEANVTGPPRKTSFNGVTVDLSQYPQAYARYVELAGNKWKHPAWGLGAKDLLNEIVTGNHPLSAVYQIRSDGPDGGKDVFIRDIIRQYRDGARTQLLEEFPQIADQVGVKKEHQRALKMPQIG